MGFWSDVINEVLDGDGFGRGYYRKDENFHQLYSLLYFDFGLVPPRNLKDGTQVPLKMSAGLDGKIYKFEVHGNPNSTRHFVNTGWGNLFGHIARDIPIQRNKTWAYDISRLNEGILIGETVFTSDAKVSQSEESLHLLQVVGAAMMKPLSNVPAIRLEFGGMWEQYRIPDYIDIAVESLHPFSDDDFYRLIDLIVHNYRNRNAPASYAYSANPLNGTLRLTVTEKVEETVAPPEPAPQPQEEDGFPYEFYRGLGLIDDEDMVLVDSFIGVVRAPMRSEMAREHLLNYKP